jgi:tetratricopeptide (TPR) repeat protein
MKRILSLAALVSLVWAMTAFGRQAPPAAPQAAQPAAPSDRDAYNKAVRIADPAEQIKALEQFIKDYPTSASVRGAYQILFTASMRASQKAVEYADKAVEMAPEAERPMALNSFAWPLADQGIHLEKARDYATRAVEAARAKDVNKRQLAMILDTLALAQYKLGDYGSAEKTQREAIGYLPTGPESIVGNGEYRSRLGVILVKTGKHEEATELLASSLLFGEPKGAAKALDDAIAALGGDAAAKKSELFKKAGDQYLASAQKKESAQSRVAVGYARNGVLPGEALALARKAVDALTPKSSFEAYIEAHKTLGVIHSYQKNHAEAVERLGKIAPLAQPFDADLFVRLGQSLEALGKDDEALRVYLDEAVLFPAPPIMTPLTALYKRLNGSDAGLKEKIGKLTEEAVNFKPSGPPKTSASRLGVLAELFTGSECPPCVAADIGFDHVLAGYDRKAAVVLEYHLHVPGPDPMTNDDAEARAKYYNVGGTPSVFIGGSDAAGGGGGKPMAKNRFDVYSYLLDRKLARQPEASIDLGGSLKGSSLTVQATAKTAAKGDLKLRIAVVEDPLHYPGGNGLSEHRVVVRRMIGTPAGIALADGKATLDETIDLATVTADLKNYLEKWEKNPPGRFSSLKNFTWKEKKHEINSANLGLVAFIQDDATKEVLQASYVKLESGARATQSSAR